MTTSSLLARSRPSTKSSKTHRNRVQVGRYFSLTRARGQRPKLDPSFFRRRHAPNLIWPADRSWLVASEVDFDSTLVGGNAELIDTIVESPKLEAWQVEPTDSLAVCFATPRQLEKVFAVDLEFRHPRNRRSGGGNSGPGDPVLLHRLRRPSWTQPHSAGAFPRKYTLRPSSISATTDTFCPAARQGSIR